MRNTRLIAASLALALASPVAVAEWSVEGEITLATDYVFRGVSQTDRKPAFQPGLTVSHASGFYAGLWASNVDFDDPDDGIKGELDIFVGWNADLGERLNLDLLLSRYTYPGANDGYEADYNELVTTLTFDDTWFLALGYTNDYARSGEKATYVQVGAEFPLGGSEDWTAGFSVGRHNLDDVFGASYTDYRFGVSRSFGNNTLDLSWIGTNGAGDAIAPREWTGDRVVLSFTIGIGK